MKGLLMLQRAVHTHIITSRYGAPLIMETGQGLIVEINDGDFFQYRGNLFYDPVKTSVIRLAYKTCDEKFCEYWLDGPGDILFPDWP